MIKNYNFNISEEEKKQILSLHESRTKRHYLINEQQKTAFNDEIEKKYVKQIQSQLKFTGADLDGKLGVNTFNAIMAKLTGTSGTPEEIKAAADKAAAEKAAAEKAAAAKVASGGGTPEEIKAAADKAAAEKAAAAKVASGGGTPEEIKAAADKAAAEKAAADKLAAEKAAADKLAADKLAADKLTDPSDTTY